MEFPNDPVHFPNTVSGIGVEYTNSKNEVYKKPDLIFTKPLKPLNPNLFIESEIAAENIKIKNQIQGLQQTKQELILKDMIEKLEFQREQDKIAKLNGLLNNYYFTSFLDELQNKIKLTQNRRLDDLQNEMVETNKETQELADSLKKEKQKKSQEYWQLRQEGKTHEEIIKMREEQKAKSLSIKKEEIEAKVSQEVQTMIENIEGEEMKEEDIEGIKAKIKEEYEKKLEKVEEEYSEKLEQVKQKIMDESEIEATYKANFIEKDIKPFNNKIATTLKNFENQIEVLEKIELIDQNIQSGKSLDKEISKTLLNNLSQLANKVFKTDIPELVTASKKGKNTERKVFYNEIKSELAKIQEENNFDLEILRQGMMDLENLYITKEQKTTLKTSSRAQIKEELADRRRFLNNYKEIYKYQFS